MNPKDVSQPVVSYLDPLVNVNNNSTFDPESIWVDVTKLLISGKDRGRINSYYLPSPPLIHKGAQWKSIFNKYGLSISMGQGKRLSA